VLLLVVGAVVAEAVALAIVAILSVRALLTADTASTGLSVGVAVLSLAVAALLVAAGRALLSGRRWGRAPVLTWQLLQLAVAVPAVQADLAAVPVALLTGSLVVVVGLFVPAVVRHTAGAAEPPTF